MAIIGIDLGTTNSLAAVWKDGKSVLIPNAAGEYLTPSAVSLDEDGSILVGRVARERLISHPERSASSFKRYMGTDRTLTLGGKTFSPEDLSALVLRRLKEDAEAFLGEAVTEAVVSVPAYFGDRQRCATKRAGRLAGLFVERLVNEPSAAALACRMENGEEDQKFLVFDFGGGTLDVSVVDCFLNVVSIVSVSGDNHLGGDDFDREIARYFCRENNLDYDTLPPVQRAVLLKQAEQCKVALGVRERVLSVIETEGFSGSLVLENSRLIELCADLFTRMTLPVRQAIADSCFKLNEIDAVIPVGGSCRMPVVSQYLRHMLGRDVAKTGSPDTMVALGAGVYAGIKARSSDLREMLLTDISPFTLGAAVYNRSNPAHGLMAPIIERNCVLPSSRQQRFYTVSDGQTDIRIQVYQGESYYCAENLKLGELELKVPSAASGEESVDVRFTYDINGILEVEATNETTGCTARAVIVERESEISEQAVERRLAELQALKTHPRDQEENRLAVARCERMFQETLGARRRAAGRALEYFHKILDTQDTHLILLARRDIMEFLDRAERELELPDSFRADLAQEE